LIDTIFGQKIKAWLQGGLSPPKATTESAKAVLGRPVFCAIPFDERGEPLVDAIVGLPPLKTPVNAKFDVEVVDWFKSQRRGYQTRMNAVLRRYMETHRKAD
jgi:uncharacterized protein (DUF4415 family)